MVLWNFESRFSIIGILCFSRNVSPYHNMYLISLFGIAAVVTGSLKVNVSDFIVIQLNPDLPRLDLPQTPIYRGQFLPPNRA